MLFKCVVCSRTSESDALDPSCPRCGSAVMFTEQDPPILHRESFENKPSGVWRYEELLPGLRSGARVTLGEGGTPMPLAERLGKRLGLSKLLIKDETRNPTGSFIDRGSTVLVSLAREAGAATCSCDTTGNLGASLAAYCAKAGISAEITIRPNTDRGKLYQMLAYGARLELSSQAGVGGSKGNLAVSAANPYILEGEKTTGFEIVQDLAWTPPDVIVIPVGTGGHLAMIWRAILQLRDAGLVEKSKCRLLGVQFRGSAPIVNPRRGTKAGTPGGGFFTELEESEPTFGEVAKQAMKDSGGRGLETTIGETVSATALLARTEGIFAEPAAASVIASLDRAKSEGLIRNDETVVCVVTGAGLKDTRAIARIAKAARQTVVPAEPASPARLQVGDTKTVLLRALEREPTFGYGLWKEVSSQRKITTASIYQHLGELEELGLVARSGASSVRGRERIYYSLTKRGSDFLRIAGRMERD